MKKMDINKIKQYLEDIFVLVYQKKSIESMIYQSDVRIEEIEKKKAYDTNVANTQIKQVTQKRWEERFYAYEKKKKISKIMTILLVVAFFILTLVLSNLILLIPCVISGYIIFRIVLFIKNKKAEHEDFEFKNKEEKRMLSEIEERYAYRKRYEDELDNQEKALDKTEETLSSTFQRFGEDFPMFKPYLSLECMVYLYNFIEQEGQETDIRICLEELGQVKILNQLSREVDKREEEIDDIESSFYAELEDIKDDFVNMSKNLYSSYEGEINRISKRTDRQEISHYFQVLELCEFINSRER